MSEQENKKGSVERGFRGRIMRLKKTFTHENKRKGGKQMVLQRINGKASLGLQGRP